MMIDLRSDTVTKPTRAMRVAMAEAEVGDDVYGEDPTVRRLEETVAAMFGHEAAMFVPTGVMANQVAVRLLVPPGGELVLDADAHIVAHEDGAASWHGGVQTRTTLSPQGLLRPEDLRRLLRRGDAYTVGTDAVAVEQTHNRGGGAVYSLERLQQLKDITGAAGIRLHCDGARIWNAHVATGVPLASYGGLFDTLSVCLSKGLGAPAGSVVMFPAQYAAEARRMRHRMGGSMRQAGILAAGGLLAVANHVERLAEDHENARVLAQKLNEHGLEPVAPQTNIVLLAVPDAAAAAARCRDAGVLVSAFGPQLLRLVTHMDVTLKDCLKAADVVAGAVKS